MRCLRYGRMAMRRLHRLVMHSYESMTFTPKQAISAWAFLKAVLIVLQNRVAMPLPERSQRCRVRTAFGYYKDHLACYKNVIHEAKKSCFRGRPEICSVQAFTYLLKCWLFPDSRTNSSEVCSAIHVYSRVRFAALYTIAGLGLFEPSCTGIELCKGAQRTEQMGRQWRRDHSNTSRYRVVKLPANRLGSSQTDAPWNRLLDGACRTFWPGSRGKHVRHCTCRQIGQTAFADARRLQDPFSMAAQELARIAGHCFN